jgi:hypothetical protein
MSGETSRLKKEPKPPTWATRSATRFKLAAAPRGEGSHRKTPAADPRAQASKPRKPRLATVPSRASVFSFSSGKFAAAAAAARSRKGASG